MFLNQMNLELESEYQSQWIPMLLNLMNQLQIGMVQSKEPKLQELFWKNMVGPNFAQGVKLTGGEKAKFIAESILNHVEKL